MSKRIGVGVIGCGEIAHVHLPNIARSPRAELKAVCDLSLAAAEFSAAKYGASRAYSDVRDLLADREVECVHILTPPATHETLIRLALEQQRHVICEKPITLDYSTLIELLELGKRQCCLLIECQHYRFNDVVLELHRRLQAGQIGELREIQCHLTLDLSESKLCSPAGARAAAGLPLGIVHDFLPHLTYLLLSFTESDPAVEWVDHRSGLETGKVNPLQVSLEAFLRLGDLRASIRFNSDTSPDAFRVLLGGTRGELQAELFNPCLWKRGRPFTGARTAIGRGYTALSTLRQSGRLVLDKIRGVDPYQGVAPMLDAAYREILVGSAAACTDSLTIRTAQLIDLLQAKALGPAGVSPPRARETSSLQQ